MTENPPGIKPVATDSWGLELSIQLDPDGGPEVTREAVTATDLSELQAEAWRENWLRSGRTDVALDDLDFEIIPVFGRNNSQVASSLMLRSTGPDGTVGSLPFSIFALSHVASRASQRLLATGVLGDEDLYYYRVIPRRLASEAPTSPADSKKGPGGGFTLREDKNAPLTCLKLPLPPLLRGARAINVDTERNRYPVFYTAEALAQAEQAARRGGQFEPPVETGALLVGPICTCPQTKECFSVITDVIELLDTEAKTYSLTLSGRTWQRIQVVIRTMQNQPETRYHRMIGQCHGHNFKPLESTGLSTSAFVSRDDQLWNNAVFSRQPHQLCHIFGLDADSRKDERLFGLEDARLLQRGYYVIPEFPSTSPGA